MKKGTIIALIVAVVLIFGGGMILVLGLSFAGNGAPESKLSQMEVLIQEPFESIQIDTDDCDVTFVPYKGTANAHVVILEQEEVSHRVQVEDGTLQIEMIDQRKWTDYVSFFHVFGRMETMEITVYLPETEYATVWVTTDTGDIRTPAPLSAKEILLRSSTGDILCDSSATELLDCMTSTGAISIRDGEVTVMKLQSSTGDFTLQGVTGTEIQLKNSTGETELERVTAQMLICTTDTGDVELENVQAENYLQIFTSTGDVGLESCDAGSVNIETDTGDVEGHFLSPKRFSAYSDTGTVKVPQSQEGGECRIESNTGDIHFQ